MGSELPTRPSSAPWSVGGTSVLRIDIGAVLDGLNFSTVIDTHHRGNAPGGQELQPLSWRRRQGKARCLAEQAVEEGGMAARTESPGSAGEQPKRR